MTRHNLQLHLSWLQSQKVTPPVGVPPTASTRPAPAAQTVYEDIGEDRELEVIRAPPKPVPARRDAQVASGSQEFARPAAPTYIPKPLPDTTGVLAEDTMAKLTSASRPKKSTLISQQPQLATPASTSSTSSLTMGYANMLRSGMITTLCLLSVVMS